VNIANKSPGVSTAMAVVAGIAAQNVIGCFASRGTTIVTAGAVSCVVRVYKYSHRP